MAITASLVTRPRRPRVKAVVLALAVLMAATFLALVIPAVREVRFRHACTKLGGQLDQTTDDVEPLVSGRTVYSCYGSDGRLLDDW